LCLTPPAEGFPWDDLREIFSGCQWMAKVPNAVDILSKIWTAWAGRTSVTDDRRAGDSMSSHSLKTTQNSINRSCQRQLLSLWFSLGFDGIAGKTWPCCWGVVYSVIVLTDSTPLCAHNAVYLASPANSFPDAEVASKPCYQQSNSQVSDNGAGTVNARWHLKNVSPA